jgi:hypothetical protein
MTSALQTLPRALRLLNESIIGGEVHADACYQTEPDPPGAITAHYAGLYDFHGDPIIETDTVGSGMHAKEFQYRLGALASAFNALPALVEMAEDWISYVDSGEHLAPSEVAQEWQATAEALAQRILDTLPPAIVQAARDEVTTGVQ